MRHQIAHHSKQFAEGDEEGAFLLADRHGREGAVELLHTVSPGLRDRG
jgi:hypothetical protein